MMVRHSRRMLAVFGLVLCAAPAAAQTPAVTAPKNVLSINPIGVVFSIVNVEYERALTSNVSLGVASTWWDFDEDASDDFRDQFTYTSADAKLRYYPGTVLRGFSVGLLAGITKVEATIHSCDFGQPCVEERESKMAPSAGVALDYSWRLGDREKFFIGLGAGAKRIFLDDEDDDFMVAYPFVRFNLGWAF